MINSNVLVRFAEKINVLNLLIFYSRLMILQMVAPEA